jgi:hypothetical protein
MGKKIAWAREVRNVPILAALLLAMIWGEAIADSDESIWGPATWDGTLPLPAQTIRSKIVSVNLAKLNLPAAKVIHFPLPDGLVIDINKEREEKFGSRGKVWIGRVAGDPTSIATFSLVGKVLVGDVLLSNGRLFRLSHVAEGVQVIIELESRRFPPEADRRFLDKATADFSTRMTRTRSLVESMALSCPQDPAERIDILVAYTEAACKAANNGIPCTDSVHHDPVIDRIYEAVSETNQTYINSLLSQRLSLAPVHALGPFTESTPDNDLDLMLLTDEAAAESQGQQINASLLELHDLKIRYAADAVVLITQPRDRYPNCDGTDLDPDCPACGYSPAMTSGGPIPGGQAFAMVPLDCATGIFSFGHELGHVMGANHDLATSPQDIAFAYSHGLVRSSPPSGAPWRTVMAHNIPECKSGGDRDGCVRLPYWSNLNVVLPNGDHMGSTTENNVQTIKDTANTVANNELSSVCGNGVWMKDTWQDRGEEPDPAQAGLPMWKSPYIWVRNEQDGDRGWLHQHEHQNPRPGQKNWVYVKLHNGGGATTGNLELRVAPASTGLVWPESWNLVVGTNTLNLNANSTEIAEFGWDNLPEPAQYSFLARWLSPDDPMTTAESAAIEPNVRGNNNIIWRNVNILDLTSTATVSTELTVANPTDLPMEARLVIRLPKTSRGAFLTFGRISIAMDSRLSEVWEKGGRASGGLEVGEKWSEVTESDGATLEKLYLPPRFKGTLIIQFSKRDVGVFPRGLFEVDVMQTRGNGNLVGGVTYEISSSK